MKRKGWNEPVYKGWTLRDRLAPKCVEARKGPKRLFADNDEQIKKSIDIQEAKAED